jgi:hypothetical protein
MVVTAIHTGPVRVKPRDHIALALRDEFDVEAENRHLLAVAQAVLDFGGLSALAFREHGR